MLKPSMMKTFMAVRKRKDRERWIVDLRHAGRRYIMNSPENTKRGAQAYELVLRGKLARGESLKSSIKNEAKNFKDFLEEWFQDYVAVNNKLSERQSKESMMRLHLIPTFGHLKLEDLTTEKIDRYKAKKLKEGLNPKTINNQLAVLSKCLNSALDWGELSTVPKISRLKTTVKTPRFLTQEECIQLLSDYNEPLWRRMVLTGIHTGLRLGELLGLQWKDVDFDRCVIDVRHSRVRGELTSPKSHRSRLVPMTTVLSSELSSQPHDHGFVFAKKNGSPHETHQASSALIRMCRRTGLDKIGWHILRHTFASHLVMRGVPLRHVQELLGHSTITMTEKYSHLAPSSLHSAVAVLNKEFESFGNHMETKALKATV